MLSKSPETSVKIRLTQLHLTFRNPTSIFIEVQHQLSGKLSWAYVTIYLFSPRGFLKCKWALRHAWLGIEVMTPFPMMGHIHIWTKHYICCSACGRQFDSYSDAVLHCPFYQYNTELHQMLLTWQYLKNDHRLDYLIIYLTNWKKNSKIKF